MSDNNAPDLAALWRLVVDRLADDLNPTSAGLWFDDCEPLAAVGGKLIAAQPNELKYNTINERYLDKVNGALAALFGDGFSARFVQSPVDIGAARAMAAESSDVNATAASTDGGGAAPLIDAALKTAAKLIDDKVRRVEFNPLDPLDYDAGLPQFPLETLPPKTGAYIQALSLSAQASVDLAGAMALGVLSIACRGRRPVSVPSGHVENPCIYIAPISEPSERKSSIFKTLMAPLVEFTVEFNAKLAVDMNKNRSERLIIESRINEIIKKSAKEPSYIVDHEEELGKLNAKLAEFRDLAPLQLYGSDATPESIIKALRQQNSVFALACADGGLIFDSIDRYIPKGGLTVFLNGYSGDAIIVNRVQQGREFTSVNDPVLTILAPIQNIVAADLFDDKQKAGRGLLSRILFVRCRTMIGRRLFSPPPLPRDAAAAFNAVCAAALNSHDSGVGCNYLL